MQTWIALYRGINVGGRSKLPMEALAQTLESAGCGAVRTYLQSGNVVFQSSLKSKPKLSAQLADATEAEFGFRPRILLLTGTDLQAAVANNPFASAEDESKSLHFFFLDAIPDSPDIEGIAELATPTESYKLIETVFYLHAPQGFGRSKLAAGAERKLGVAATARNYTTVRNLSAMLSAD